MSTHQKGDSLTFLFSSPHMLWCDDSNHRQRPYFIRLDKLQAMTIRMERNRNDTGVKWKDELVLSRLWWTLEKIRSQQEDNVPNESSEKNSRRIYGE